MLIRYKKNMEKIAMGLLSFMPEEKDVKKLLDTIQSYEVNEDWHLYLWREEDILGAIGIKIDDNKAIIQHISVNPSHRNSGLGNQMVRAVQNKYGTTYDVQADKAVQTFFDKCMNNEKNENESCE